ncbi:hypothetical protein GC177_05370 [bacterium]|nr:hypothetical protein [bacterium]
MSGIKDWSSNPANNIAGPPYGWPEGMAPSAVNNCARQMMADIRTWYADSQWVNLGHEPSYLSANSFALAGDVTGIYHKGRRVRLTDNGADLYATIADSGYGSPNTTVTVDLSSLTSNLTAVALGALSALNASVPSNIVNRAADGAAGQPAYAFYNDENTGIYRSAADRLDVATGGVQRLSVLQGLVVDVNEADPGNGNAVINDARIKSLNGGPLAGFRNTIINGAFDIWQRGTSFGSNGFVADRWQFNYGSGGAATVSRSAFSPGESVGDGTQPLYSLQWNQTTGGTGNYLMQPIENVRLLSGQQVTVSFYARTVSGSMTLSCFLRQCFGTGGSPSSNNDSSTQTAGLTTNWQRFRLTWTLDSISGKTMGSNANDYLGLIFSGPSGSTFNLLLWGVQLERGPFATPFEGRQMATELGLCQRYFWKSFRASVTPAQNTGREGAIMLTATGTTTNLSVCAQVRLPVPMRALPSITTYNPQASNANWRNVGAGTDLAVIVDSNNLSEQSFVLYNNAASVDNALYSIHATANAEY